jgi:hypothetical protein
MTELGYMIWFAATALMTVTVLTLGTLASAGLLGRHSSGDRHPGPQGQPGAPDGVPFARSSAVGDSMHPDHEQRAA